MNLVPLADIVVRPDRQRKVFDDTPLAELRDSIASRGLIHAILLRKNDEGALELVAGERRFRAVSQLAKDGKPIVYDSSPVPLGSIPATIFHLSDLASAKEVELEENLLRVQLSWQERTEAILGIHRLRQEQNPSQTQVATINEIAEATGSNPLGLKTEFQKAKIVAAHLNKPEIANARTLGEAVQLVLKQEEEEVTAHLLMRRQKAKASGKGKAAPSILLRHGDSYEIIPSLDPGTFDLILSDPPYGINAGAGGFRGRTVHHHNYDDSPEDARKAIDFLLLEGFRVTKSRANIFFFLTAYNFAYAFDAAQRMGWQPYPGLITWQKSESEGLAPWGAHGFRRTTEGIFCATKGKRFLLSNPVDVLSYRRVHRSARIYGAQKPIDLIRFLIEISTLPSENILDPFSGSGTTARAARLLGRRCLGVEVSEAAHNTAMTYVFSDDLSIDSEEETE